VNAQNFLDALLGKVSLRRFSYHNLTLGKPVTSLVSWTCDMHYQYLSC